MRDHYIHVAHHDSLQFPTPDTYRVLTNKEYHKPPKIKVSYLNNEIPHMALTNKVLHWLQVKAWAFLRKYGNVTVHSDIRDTIGYNRVHLDLDNLSRALLEHSYVLESIFNHRCDIILIGNDIMRALRMECDKTGMYSIMLPMNTPETLHNGKQKFSLGGMRIVMVPWMTGAVPLSSRDLTD